MMTKIKFAAALLASFFVPFLGATLITLFAAGAHAPKPAAAAVDMSDVAESGNYLATAAGPVSGFMSGPFAVKLDALPTAAGLVTQIDTAIAAVPRVEYVWGATSAAATTASRWPIAGSTAAYATSVHQAGTIAPYAITCTSMWATHALGGLSTDTVTFTLEREAVATSATVTITAGSAALFTASINEAFAAGELISVKSVQSGSTAGASIQPRVGISCKSP